MKSSTGNIAAVSLNGFAGALALHGGTRCAKFDLVRHLRPSRISDCMVTAMYPLAALTATTGPDGRRLSPASPLSIR